jgi:esterase
MPTIQFACETAVSRFADVNGLRLHWLEWGPAGGPGLCFLHGGSAHAHWFDGVVAAFSDRFRVVALDQRGHGESAWARPAAYATEDFAADIDGVFDVLGWGQAVLVGHSMGGHNAMAFAAWHPHRMRGLVIVDSRPSIPEERLSRLRRRGKHVLRHHPSLDDALAAFRLLPRETTADPALLAHLARAGVVQRDGAWMYRFDPDGNRQRRPADVWALLERIMAPTLIVRGELSPILTREVAERLRAGIRLAKLVEIPGAYHHLVLDAPQVFAATLEPFLRALD